MNEAGMRNLRNPSCWNRSHNNNENKIKRKEKGERRKEKGERRKEKGERRKERKGKERKGKERKGKKGKEVSGEEYDLANDEEHSKGKGKGKEPNRKRCSINANSELRNKWAINYLEEKATI